MGGHVAPQTAASGERGVAHQALVGLQARVGPDVSFEDARRGEAPAALHTLEGPFSCVGPGEGGKKKQRKNKSQCTLLLRLPALPVLAADHPDLTCCFRWLDFL